MSKASYKVLLPGTMNMEKTANHTISFLISLSYRGCMAKRLVKQYKNLSAMVALILLVSISTGLVSVAVAKPYFNITQNMNLSQVLVA
jgi:hypothetical protein